VIVNGYDIKPRTNLRWAPLQGTNLCSADLRWADIYEANLAKANLHGASLRGAYFKGADLKDADLSCANLIEANLTGANIHGANIRYSIGNGAEIKTLLTTKYHISYTDEILAISCEQHPKKDWLNFDDDTIAKMDKGALDWWNEWKPRLIDFGVFEGFEQ